MNPSVGEPSAKSAYRVRPAVASDLPALAGIYDDEVRHGYATFETDPPGTAPFEARLAGEDHLLVAEAGGVVGGYAYSGWYRARAAYAATRETSVYLHPDARGQGVGRLLYEALLGRLDTDGIHRVIAGIALPNQASERLHRACGFVPVGVFTEVGYKCDRWIDVAFYERRSPR